MYRCPRCQTITPGDFEYRAGATFVILCPECGKPLYEDDRVREEEEDGEN